MIKKLIAKILVWFVVIPIVVLTALLLLLTALVAGLLAIVRFPFDVVRTLLLSSLRGLVQEKKKDVQTVFQVSSERERLQ